MNSLVCARHLCGFRPNRRYLVSMSALVSRSGVRLAGISCPGCTLVTPPAVWAHQPTAARPTTQQPPKTCECDPFGPESDSARRTCRHDTAPWGIAARSRQEGATRTKYERTYSSACHDECPAHIAACGKESVCHGQAVRAWRKSWVEPIRNVNNNCVRARLK